MVHNDRLVVVMMVLIVEGVVSVVVLEKGSEPGAHLARSEHSPARPTRDPELAKAGQPEPQGSLADRPDA